LTAGGSRSLEHQTTNLGIDGSNPSGRASEIKGLRKLWSSDGIDGIGRG
jgi:hypothetical protein